MEPLAVMIKPASGFCNMKCAYCFYRDEMKKRERGYLGFMSEETLKNVIRKTLPRAKESIYYIFQGGEPTLRGIGFFQKALEYQKQYNKNHVMIYNSIQTNGYCIDEEWCRFLAGNKFLTGLSLDGIRETHDACRRGADGEGSFKNVLRTADLFDKYGVMYNILTVVTGFVAENPEKIYGFYKNRGWRHQQYIACMEPLVPEGDGYGLTPELYGEFLIKLFYLFLSDWERGRAPFIRQFENYIQKLLGLIPEACEHAGKCGRQYAVEADGTVYPCDFYMTDPYCLGNFNRDNLKSIDERRREILFLEESEKISAECRRCQYFFLCRSGCQRNRRYERETDGYKDRFCKAYKMFFDRCLEDMKRICKEISVK